MTTTEHTSQTIAKCGNGHVVRGTYSNGRYAAATPGARVAGLSLQCPCGDSGVIKTLFAATTDKACGGTCRGAKGPNCDCSCNGRNHGEAHRFVAAQA